MKKSNLVSEDERKFIELVRKLKSKKSVLFHFERIDELVNHFQILETDNRIVFSTPQVKNFLPVIISHRYVLTTKKESFSLILPASEKQNVLRMPQYIETSSYDQFGGEVEPPLWTTFRINDNLNESLHKRARKAGSIKNIIHS